MNGRFYHVLRARLFVLSILTTVVFVGCHAPQQRSSTELVRHGSMHETIGQKQHHGRVGLAEIVERAHCYGVGALAGLQGEITIEDSVATVTGVTADGHLEALQPADMQATLLVGQSVQDWTSLTLNEAVSHTRFDEMIASAASEAGLDKVGPFMFTIKGEFTDVRLHVINGACPIRARMKKLELPQDQQPFELEAKTLAGTLVGVYAADSVGKLTHPATSTHVHLIYRDPQTDQRVTGHLEQVGLAAGAVLRLPKPDVQRSVSAAR